MIRIGSLNEYIQIQQLQKTADGAGGFTESWPAVQWVWAAHGTSNLRTDAYENGIAVFKTGHVWIVRYNEMTPSLDMRIIDADGEIYNLTGIVEIFDSAHKKYWKITTLKTNTGGTSSNSGQVGSASANWTSFDYNQATGVITFSGGTGSDDTVIEFVDVNTGLSYVAPDGASLSIGPFQGNTIQNMYLAPGQVGIKWRRQIPNAPYTPTTDWATGVIEVAKYSQRPFKIAYNGVTGILYYDIAASSFPIHPVNIAGTVLDIANNIGEFLSIWGADPVNKAKATIISETQFPVSGDAENYTVLLSPVDPSQPWGFGYIYAQ